ncbi:MAG: hypothetical protein LBV29_07555 [Azoarcus sp.]|jgi:hypothetical protein|nr:hypothetical protein [Azoarcus sp.]
MKLNRLNGLIFGLMLGLASHQAAGANDALSGRLAELRIYDRMAGQHLPVYWHRGQAYVVGNPGNEYEISLANQASGDLLAVISVDGVNVLSGQTASSQQDGYVFGGRQSYSINGWRKNQGQVAAFYFTSLPDSYAARTGRPDNVGVIGVALFQRKPKPVAAMPRSSVSESRLSDTPRPMAQELEAGADQMQEMSKMPSSRAESLSRPIAPQQRERLGTGHGRIEDSPVNFVEFERASRKPAEILTVHYDSYTNLVARGVIRSSSYGRPCASGSRHAGCSQAFPKDTRFVPDPPR